ncbi:hypothetical protein F4604DRAFT_1928112 [Suillus subluteus]|nr:hypothetical protein F4604DRAFT_1928112 [Suillus subluteus]
MTAVPANCALYTTCIASEFVKQLFDCNVAGNAQSISPPLTIDVPTMLACQHLARVLADAYSNPIQLDLDMIRYNEALHKRSTGMVATHEDSLLEKFPHGPERLLEKPSVILDSAGRIILWYLPDAISPWIQAEMEDATIGMGSLLMKSMTSGLDTQWRTFPGSFHVSDRHQLTPGCINLAPCWFMQGWEPHGLPPANGFTPEVSAALKGKGGPEIIISMQRAALLASAALRVMHPKLYWASVATHIKLARWAVERGLSDMSTCLQFWASVFNCAAVICNRQCPLHRDPSSTPKGFDVMSSVGHYCNGLMTLSNLGIRLQYNSGAMVGCSGHFVRHGVTYTGNRIVWAWFIRDSLQNFVGTPRPSYATYMGVD